MQSRRVLVSGMGLVTPLGKNTKTTWDRLVRGDVGISFSQEHTLPVARCDSVTKEDLQRITQSNPRALEPRFISLCLLACEEALADSGLSQSDFDALNRNVAVVVGCGMGSATSEIPPAALALSQGRKISPYFVPRLLPNLAGGNVSILHRFTGPLLCPSTACASGAHAISEAFRLIERGEVEVAVCGGTESAIDTMALAGFSRLKALSQSSNPQRASIPFDQERDGFVMGEGSGILILESEDHFLKRKGKSAYAFFSGVGQSSDAYHITSPCPNGSGAESAMRGALKNVTDLSLVGYCNAHATSTPMGDLIEANAISRIFSSVANKKLLVSSTKASLGHLLGAAGAVEAALTVLSLHHATVPGTTGLQVLDSKLPQAYLNYPHEAVFDQSFSYALTNSFGFGGTNVSLCFEKGKL